LKITECLWIDKFVDKIIGKHNVFPDEVEEVLSNQPFNTYEAAAEWFNGHDMTDFEDQLLVNQMLKERLRELR